MSHGRTKVKSERDPTSSFVRTNLLLWHIAWHSFTGAVTTLSPLVNVPVYGPATFQYHCTGKQGSLWVGGRDTFHPNCQSLLAAWSQDRKSKVGVGRGVRGPNWLLKSTLLLWQQTYPVMMPLIHSWGQSIHLSTLLLGGICISNAQTSTMWPCCFALDDCTPFW